MIVEITDAKEKQAIARKVLEALTDWFGIEESREEYISGSAGWTFFAAKEEGEAVGFLCLKETGKATVELAVMGVLKDWHRSGIGRALVEKAKETAKSQGYEFMQVKTVKMGMYEDYDRTNLFYISCGFKEFEVFPLLWDEANPCQIYVMSLSEGRNTMEGKNDSICIKSAETDEELCGRGYVHCTAWQQAYRGIVCDRYLDTMTVEATTARARRFPENTIVAKDGEKVVGFAVYGPSRDEDLPNAGEVEAIYVLKQYYGRKVGYRLMNEAFSRLSEYDTIFVWVLEKNERAIRFYHKYGFEFDGHKKEWTLGTPVSIVRMVMNRK